MDLSRLQPAPHSSKRKKRVGRGEGSGHGKTACRGHKGQRARSGGGTRPGFEGGQMPLMRRVPKRGFHNPFRVRYAIVNLGQLEIFDPKTEVTSELLFSKGLVRNKKTLVKILGAGTLSKSLTVKANGFSAKARAKIESLGGKVEVITDA